jgi:hypothetical protein
MTQHNVSGDTLHTGPIDKAEVEMIVRNRMNGYKPQEGTALKTALYIVELCKRYGIADETFSEEQPEEIDFCED